LSKFRFVVHLTPERANVLLIVVSAINYQGHI